MAIPTQIERRQRFHVSEPRETCVGRQYTVINDHATEVVTINNGCIGCTCGLDKVFLTCSHIQIVEQIEAAYCVEARDRAQYSAVFGV